MRPPAQPAPLASWCIALVMVLALLAVFLYWIWTPGILGDLPLSEKYRAQIEDHLSVPPAQRDRPRGVMLASSGAMCAVAGPRQLSSEGPDLLVLPFTFATFDDFNPIVERLAALQPDFIIIQSAVLVESTPPLNRQYKYFIGNLNYRIRSAVLGDAPETYPDLEFGAVCDRERLPAKAWANMEAKFISKPKEQLSRAARVRIITGLETFDRAGIPVMIVGVPRYSSTAEYGESLMTKAHDLIRNSPRPIGRVTFHRMTELFPAELFFDPLHVISSVRPNYRAWLRAEIRKSLHSP